MALLGDLRTLGKSFDDTSEGLSCAGTVLESRTIKVDGRAFLFLGKKGEIRLKLERSLAAARKLQKQKPDVYAVGAGGWTKIVTTVEEPPEDLIEAWVRESYDLVAGPKPEKKKPSKKKTKTKTKKKKKR